MAKKQKAKRLRENTIKYHTCRVMEYPVIVHESKFGVDVNCPVLPGCASQGDTFEQALENIRFAIIEYIEAVKKVKKGERLIMIKVPV